MKNVLFFLRRRWYLGLLLLLLLLALVFRILTSQLPTASQPVTTWNGIIPGKTTLDEIRAKLGQESGRRQVDGQTIIEYKSAYPDFPNDIYTTDNVAGLVRQRIPPDKSNTYSDFLSSLGKEDLIVYTSEFEELFPLYVFLKKGIAVGVGPNGILMEIWYFAPTTQEDFLSKYGSLFSTSVPVETEGEPGPPVPPPEFQ